MPLHPPPNTLPVPSSDVLSLLAALSPQHIQTSEFLCPYPCQPQQQLPQSARQRRARRSASASSSTSTPFYSSGAVPPKYEQGGDGKWRPASEWSLHGVKLPPRTNSESNLTPTPSDLLHPDLDETDSIDRNGDGIIDTSDEDSGEDNSRNSSSDDVVALYDDISKSLPTGWSPLPTRTKFYSVPVVIVISLIIAIVVTLLITGVVLTHKTRRRSRKGSDIEKEAKSNNDAGIKGEDLAIALKCAKKKEKLWEKWRKQSQGKLGLRKRRRRLDPKDADESDQRTLNDSDRIPRPSFASSRTQVSSIHPEVISNVPPERDNALSTNNVSSPSEPPPSPSPSPPPIHPPAYQRRRRSLPDTRITILDGDLSAAFNSEAIPKDEEIFVNGIPLRAHVATDDKAVLEQMRQGVSAPAPEIWVQDNSSEVIAAPTSSLNLTPHVPLWEDEFLGDFNDNDENNPSMKDNTAVHQMADTLCSPLPLPPPSAQRIHRHLDHPINNEPMSISCLYMADLPIAGPSAPPFDDPGGTEPLAPSAPPLRDEYEELRASAPMFGGDNEEEDVQLGEEEQENEMGLHRSHAEQMGMAVRTGEPQEQDRRPRGRERAQRESVASTVTLPQYKP